ncbi:MAG TPA: DUF1223 domain-containing protein [Acidobacteriaceae bacterium]|nr:DUF1223 domain-containing protein [Acidobacteriaceae bacterium]
MALLASSRIRIFLAFALAAALAIALLGLRHNSAVLASGPAPNPTSSAASPTPVLVELFTSEGCSSCPPADALLARLQHDQPVPSARIITLEEHVDYWDSLGWRDRYSSHDITARQIAYTRRLHLDDNYTPQMIVDGADQFVGSNSSQALHAITAAAARPKLALSISSVTLTGGQVTGIASTTPGNALPSATLYAALVETMSSTNVLNGENGGRTLHHVDPVLSLQKIGDLRHASTTPVSFSLTLPRGTDPSALGIVVFAQQPDQGPILGATSAPLAHKP